MAHHALGIIMEVQSGRKQVEVHLDNPLPIVQQQEPGIMVTGWKCFKMLSVMVTDRQRK